MVNYQFRANNTFAIYKLIGLCFLSFVLLFILMLVCMGLGWLSGELRIGIAVTLVFALPFLLYFLRRKLAAEEVTAILDTTHVEIRWPNRVMVIPYHEIRSYSADHLESEEDDDVESVRIRLKNGKKVRLYATSSVCDIKPLGKFREDFDTLAKTMNLKSKYWSW